MCLLKKVKGTHVGTTPSPNFYLCYIYTILCSSGLRSCTSFFAERDSRAAAARCDLLLPPLRLVSFSDCRASSEKVREYKSLFLRRTLEIDVT
jgi:hypothetical protein